MRLRDIIKNKSLKEAGEVLAFDVDSENQYLPLPLKKKERKKLKNREIWEK